MAKYVAYNRFYLNGAPTGRRYKVAEGKTAAEARAVANKYNKRWNSMRSSKRERVAGHLVSVKRAGAKRRTSTSRRYSDQLSFW